jgi:hypothetical protein
MDSRAMSKAIERRGLRRAISLLALVSLGAGFLISAPAAATGKSALVKGATVKADRHSPTGYTVWFVGAG